ncbi:hypothetical protein LIZ98_14675, partial [Caldibacillus sp. 210928-DFI.2.18]|uniref:hypothetical protein n=1 Tax=Caldibacillus sp. 210928-DFI.2.18 TaxID=2883264 RepID=UPI001D0606A1
EYVSSSKLSVFHLKMVTRIRFVVKIGRFLPQNGDENRPRRQKRGGPCKKDDEIRPRRQK